MLSATDISAIRLGIWNGHEVRRLQQLSVKRISKVQLESFIRLRQEPFISYLTGIARNSKAFSPSQLDCTEQEYYDYKFRALIAVYGDKFPVQRLKEMYFNYRLEGKDY
jgi:hypothetical protein